MTYPFTWGMALSVTVDTLVLDGTGGTTISCSIGTGTKLPDFRLGVEVGPKPGQKGFDDVRNEIESMVWEFITKGVRGL